MIAHGVNRDREREKGQRKKPAKKYKAVYRHSDRPNVEANERSQTWKRSVTHLRNADAQNSEAFNEDGEKVHPSPHHTRVLTLTDLFCEIMSTKPKGIWI